MEFSLPSVTIIRDRSSDIRELFFIESTIPWSEDLDACKDRMQRMQGDVRKLVFAGLATEETREGGKRYTCSVAGDALLEPVFHAMANLAQALHELLTNAVTLGAMLGLTKQECLATWIKATVEFVERAIDEMEEEYPEMGPRFTIHHVDGTTTKQ